MIFPRIFPNTITGEIHTNGSNCFAAIPWPMICYVIQSSGRLHKNRDARFLIRLENCALHPASSWPDSQDSCKSIIIATGSLIIRIRGDNPDLTVHFDHIRTKDHLMIHRTIKRDCLESLDHNQQLFVQGYFRRSFHPTI